MTERRDSQESPPSSQEPGSPTIHFTIGLLLEALPQEELLAALRAMLSLESDEERTVALLQRLVRETGCPMGICIGGDTRKRSPRPSSACSSAREKALGSWWSERPNELSQCRSFRPTSRSGKAGAGSTSSPSGSAFVR